jgi:2-polyprenyl-3-methyl-5-hydroxy-6-metoxy-1,4-benzoquinol methylase
MDLSIRSKLPEELDAPETDPSDYQQCVTELAVINRITLTHRPTLRWLAKATRGMTEFSLLDVGYGGGDLLRAIARWAEKRGMRAFLCGIDLNPRSAETARDATPSWMDIRYQTGDVFDPINDLCPPVDFVVSSQFAHHLTDDGVVEFLRWAEANSARGWHIADLHRSAVAFHGFQLLGAAMGWHRITVNDGVISIARAFRRQEWQTYLDKADLHADIAWCMGFRYCVSRIKPAEYQGWK